MKTASEKLAEYNVRFDSQWHTDTDCPLTNCAVCEQRTNRLKDTPAAAREEWRVDDKYVMRGSDQVGSFITAELASAAVADHARAALVPRLVEALERIRDYFYLLPSDVQDAARETLAAAKGEPR